MTPDLLWCCLSSTVLLPQGKNVKEDEFDALGHMLSSAKWELPMVEEYKNDLAQPQYQASSSLGVPKSTSNAVVVQQPKPDPMSPATPEQWIKVDKMVAWLRTSFFVLVFRISF